MTVSNRPPCPCCGEPYDEFVWKSGGWDDGPDEAPDSDCEVGVGWYIHEDDEDE